MKRIEWDVEIKIDETLLKTFEGLGNSSAGQVFALQA